MTSNRTRLIAAAILALGTGSLPAAGPALAQSAQPPGTSAAPPAGTYPAPPAGIYPAPSRPNRLRDKFEAANTTQDGHLTLDQAQAGGLRMVARNFSVIDTDHKGYVTWDDIRHFVQSRRAQRQNKTPGSAI